MISNDGLPDRSGWVVGWSWISSGLARQSAIFTTTNLLTAVLGAVASAVLARLFATSVFGAYSFAVALLGFLAGFYEFGLFTPAARLASTESPSGQRAVAAAALLLFVPVGLLFSVTILLLSFVLDGLVSVHAGAILRVAALFAFALPFGQLAQWLATGTGRLHIYSLASLGAQVAFVLAILGVLAIGQSISPTEAVTLQLATMGLGWIGLTLWLRPTFRETPRRIRQLISGARDFGFQVYLGRILGVGTYNMDVPMLGALTTPTSVGFYVLARAIASASGTPSAAFASAVFHRLTDSPVLERRWLVITIGLASVSTVVAWLLADPFLRFVFSARYAGAAALVVPLAAAAGVRGVTGLYNSFLTAHGLGKELRNAGIALTVSNLVLNFALIPPFGATGAAWASLLALVVNLGAHLAGYRKYRRGIGA